MFPSGIAFGPDGALYVVAMSSAPAGSPPMGMVLRCEPGGEMDHAATPESAAVDMVEFAFRPKASR